MSLKCAVDTFSVPGSIQSVCSDYRHQFSNKSDFTSTTYWIRTDSIQIHLFAHVHLCVRVIDATANGNNNDRKQSCCTELPSLRPANFTKQENGPHLNVRNTGKMLCFSSRKPKWKPKHHFAIQQTDCVLFCLQRTGQGFVRDNNLTVLRFMRYLHLSTVNGVWWSPKVKNRCFFLVQSLKGAV